MSTTQTVEAPLTLAQSLSVSIGASVFVAGAARMLVCLTENTLSFLCTLRR